MFDNLLESSNDSTGQSRSTLVVSLIVHAIIVSLILLVPLIYYQALPEQKFLTFLAASPAPPPPPVPRPPSVQEPVAPREVQVVRWDLDQFQAPTEIPKEIPPPSDDIPVVTNIDFGNRRLPGGVPVGIVESGGGVLSGVLGEVPDLPPPPPPKPKEPIRVGGTVQTSKLLRKVDPVYPELAKRARVSGIVLLQVVVSETGQVKDAKLIRGHPLLNQSAIDAVRQWQYSPTLLNGEPVPVIATVTVNFVLK